MNVTAKFAILWCCLWQIIIRTFPACVIYATPRNPYELLQSLPQVSGSQNFIATKSTILRYRLKWGRFHGAYLSNICMHQPDQVLSMSQAHPSNPQVCSPLFNMFFRNGDGQRDNVAMTLPISETSPDKASFVMFFLLVSISAYVRVGLTFKEMRSNVVPQSRMISSAADIVILTTA